MKQGTPTGNHSGRTQAPPVTTITRRPDGLRLSASICCRVKRPGRLAPWRVASARHRASGAPAAQIGCVRSSRTRTTQVEQPVAHRGGPALSPDRHRSAPGSGRHAGVHRADTKNRVRQLRQDATFPGRLLWSQQHCRRLSGLRVVRSVRFLSGRISEQCGGVRHPDSVDRRIRNVCMSGGQGVRNFSCFPVAG